MEKHLELDNYIPMQRLFRWLLKLSKSKSPDNLLKLGITMVQ